MRTVRAIIQARMSSSRLRGKSLMPVAGKPLLMRVIERVRAMSFVTETVVATTDEIADRPIAAFARELGVRCVTGSRDDVLARFVAASADLNDDDTIVRFTADNPFYDSGRSAKAFAKHVKQSSEYTYVDGLSPHVPEFVQVAALRRVHATATDAYDREHVTPYFRKQRIGFLVQELPKYFAGLRAEYQPLLTIDTPTDLAWIEGMLTEVETSGKSVPLDVCYEWLDRSANDRGGTELVPQTISIGDRAIGDGQPCFIVAEIGQNHNGQLDLAKRLIEMAARCGCDAVKFQKRDIAWELTRQGYQRPYDNPNSFGTTYGRHREYLELNEQQHSELRDFALQLGLIYFCTACDPPSVESMERIGNPCYKIASRDVENIPLLESISETGKPVIVSTGMAGKPEIAAAIEALGRGPSGVMLTHCVSQYPTQLSNVNLRALESLRREFGVVVGLSDHTVGIITSVAAAVLGACLIEKHITLSRAMRGTDHAAALEEEGLRRVVKYIRETELARGDGTIALLDDVQDAKRKLARSLVSRLAIPRGTPLTESMLILKSPGTGLTWRQRDQIVGKLAQRDIAADEMLDDSQFE